jgi:hypothetical protein
LTESASGNAKGEIVLLSRDFLYNALLEKQASRDGFAALNARQREFLELVAEAATYSDIIAVPKELLEAFLGGSESSLSSTNTSRLRGR